MVNGRFSSPVLDQFEDSRDLNIDETDAKGAG
ncbi:hypothetical protein ABIB94_007479 [Bradyrhizobium sp. JR7.2]